MQENVLYYNHAVDKKGSVVTRDMVTSLFHGLAEKLSSDQFKYFVEASRIPNERELYGVFVNSITDSLEKEFLGHIATEFQVARGLDSTGRVDILFSYRSVSFLVEIKVGLLNVRKLGLGGLNNEPSQKSKMRWIQAIEQLNELDVESVRPVMLKKVVKVPIAIFFHYAKGGDLSDINSSEIHKNAEEFISSDSKTYEPDFSLFSKIDPAINTRTRKIGLDKEINVRLYGVSIFGQQINEGGCK